MAIARQAFGDAVASSSTTVSVEVASWAAGETILACIRWYGTQTISSVAATSESNLTLLGTPQTGGPDSGRSQWAILSNVTTAGTKTITATFSAAPSAQGISVWRLSGCDTAGANDGDPVGASGSTANPTVNKTTTVDACAIMAVLVNNTGDGTAGTGYTAETVGDSFWFDSGEYDIDVGAAGSKTANFTLDASTWCINAIAIKPAAGGGTSILRQMMNYHGG